MAKLGHSLGLGNAPPMRHQTPKTKNKKIILDTKEYLY